MRFGPVKQFVFCASLIITLQVDAQKTKGLTAASSTPASSDVKVQINQSYTSDMAWQANLDLVKPQFSTDGFLSSWGDPKLASAECLLAQTILAAPFSTNGVEAGDVISLCSAEMVAPGSASFPSPIRFEAKLPNKTQTTGPSPVVDYALIHLVRWSMPPSSSGKSSGTPQPNGSWYLFKRDTTHSAGTIVPWTDVSGVSALSTTSHLLGDTNVAFVAVHLGIDDTCGITYDITATHTTPLNRQDVSNLIQTAISVFAGKSSTSTTGATSNKKTAGVTPPKPQAPPAPSPTTIVGIWGGQVILKQPSLPSSIAFAPSTAGTVRAYTADATKDPRDTSNETTRDGLDSSVVATCSAAPKTTPAPVADTSQQGRMPATAERSKESLQKAPQFRNAAFVLYADDSQNKGGAQTTNAATATGATKTSAPSGGNTTPQDPLSGMSQTIPNEGPHHWDVSVAFPVTSFNSIKYDSSNNLLVPKSTTSVNPYALFDLFIAPADLGTSGTKFRLSMPYLTTGIPIGNQPLQKPFVGAGFIATIKSFRFQPIVGLHIQKEVRPDSATGTATHTEWHSNLQVMIGFSITDAMKVLKVTSTSTGK